MNRFALLLSCLLPLMAGAQGGPPDGGTPVAPPPPAAPPAPQSPDESSGSPAADAPPEAGTALEKKLESCIDDEETSQGTPSVLGTLELRVEGQVQSVSGIEWKGLQHLTPEQVRGLTGLPAEGPFTVDQATRGLRRLARSNLFARLTPTLRLKEDAAPVLEVAVEEHPYIASVTFQGLQDATPDELLEELLSPTTWQLRVSKDDGAGDDDEEQEVVVSFKERRLRVTVTPPLPTCPPPRPQKEWVARLGEKDAFQPGIVLGGLTPALENVVEELRDDGYSLASLSATLHPDGRLEVFVDEGRIEGVDVEGVPDDVVPRVREALGVHPGDVFLRSDMHRAVARVQEKLPHLQVPGVGRTDQDARILEERGEEGTLRYRTQPEQEEEPRQKRKRKQYDVDFDEVVSDLWDSWDWDDDSPRSKGLITRGRRVVVQVRTRRPDFDLELLPVHTQVTGLAPGVEGRVRVWDPGDRAHATLDAALFLPLRLGGQRIPEDPDQTSRQRRLNWLLGAKVKVPALGFAELGGQVHDFTDTLDRWRLSAIDSYIYSALLNRPDADYFRRKGAAAFATWRLGQNWLLGAEYRRDTYASLVSLGPPLSLFRRDSPPFPNAPVTERRLGSLIGRVEFSSDGTSSDEEPGTLFRSPELSLLADTGEWPSRPTLRSFATLEVGRPAFGGDADTQFWKLVSDTVFYLPTGHDNSLRLRLRAAGGEDLPLQKLEGLGGWSALRGYGFKELRGDASVLASAEYRWHALGAFLDLGTVRQEEGWTDARLGVGASFHFGDEVELTAAWRADERATWTPEVRLLFSRPF
jgi:hypothetical protein